MPGAVGPAGIQDLHGTACLRDGCRWGHWREPAFARRPGEDSRCRRRAQPTGTACKVTHDRGAIFMTMGDRSQQTLPHFLAWLEQLRQRGQVHYDEKQQAWQVLGHPEVCAVLSDPSRFSSDLGGLLPVQQEDMKLFQKGNFVRLDPPRHRKLRGLVSQAFTPRMVAGLEPRIAAVTTELLDATGGDERFDLIDQLAYPLPVIVIAELLGIPEHPRSTGNRRRPLGSSICRNAPGRRVRGQG